MLIRAFTDARPLALFRIGLAIALIADLGNRLRDLHAVFGEGGVLPAANLIGWARYTPLALATSPTVFAIVASTGFVAFAALLVGYRTRVATIASLLFVLMIDARNSLVLDSGDSVARVLLVWSVFGDLGACWSLDARRAGEPRRPWALPLYVLQTQVALIYLFAGVLKLDGAWRSGDAVYRALSDPNLARWLAEPLRAQPFLCTLATYGTVALELAFAPLVLVTLRRPSLRRALIVVMVSLHVGIFLTLRVGVFSVIMPAALLLFVPFESTPNEVLPASRGRIVIATVMLFHLALIVASLLVASLKRTPFIDVYLRRIGLVQRWTMFAPEPPFVTTEVRAIGVLSDGTVRDVLPSTIPQDHYGRGAISSRWTRWFFRVAKEEPHPIEWLSNYVCRRYNGTTTGSRLLRHELFVTYRRIDPALEYGPPETWIVFHQPCEASPTDR